MQLNILKIRNIFSTDSFTDVIESIVLVSTYRKACKDTHMLNYSILADGREPSDKIILIQNILNCL